MRSLIPIANSVMTGQAHAGWSVQLSPAIQATASITHISPSGECEPWYRRSGRVRVVATEAVHDGRRDVRSLRAQAVGYLLVGSCSVYFAGDTEVFDGMADLVRDLPQGLDVALLPVAGWGLTLGPGHMDVEAAVRALELLRPRVAVPVHWGTLRIPGAWRLRRARTLGSPHRFAALAAERVPGTRVVVPVPGGHVHVPPVAPTAHS